MVEKTRLEAGRGAVRRCQHARTRYQGHSFVEMSSARLAGARHSSQVVWHFQDGR